MDPFIYPEVEIFVSKDGPHLPSRIAGLRIDGSFWPVTHCSVNMAAREAVELTLTVSCNIKTRDSSELPQAIRESLGFESGVINGTDN